MPLSDDEDGKLIEREHPRVQVQTVVLSVEDQCRLSGYLVRTVGRLCFAGFLCRVVAVAGRILPGGDLAAVGCVQFVGGEMHHWL